MTHKAYATSVSSGRAAVAVTLAALLSVAVARSDSAQAAVQGSPTTVERGGSLPIYLQPETLAEAEKPTVELAEGAALWMPGPERFYGHALRDLRDHLQQVTGAQHPLAAADANAKSGIFAGTFAQFPDFKPQEAAATQAMTSDDPEAFVVEVQGDRLFILGKSNLGLIAGVYSLLDKLGVKWFAPGDEWTNVPQLGALALDDKLNAASAGPSYKSRLFGPSVGVNSSVFKKGEREAAYTLWNLRNRMGGSAYTANYHNQDVIPQALFQTRPELFALINGKRDPREIARANPEVVKLAIESAVKYLKDNEGKGSYYNSFSVEPGDGVPPDEESLAKVGNHTPTDLAFWFANQVADGVGKAGLADKWVGVLAYSDHAGVPSFDLHPRVGVQLATSLDTSSNMTVEQRLEGFRARKAQRLGLYDYPSMVLWTRDQPGWQVNSDPLKYAANFKRWHAHGATGYLAETSDSWVNSGAGHYVAARVMWDINCDPQKELDAYYEGAFGPAAAEIRTLYEDWGKRLGRSRVQVTRAEMARWHHLISQADQKLSGKPTYLARVNDVKRYYLFLAHVRELAIDLRHPRVPSRAERFARMLRYVGSSRGTGAFHANALLPTLLNHLPLENLKFDPATLGPEFVALAQNLNDPEAWNGFPFIEDAQIDEMFAAVRLPLDGQATSPAVLDPAIKVFPADARAPAQVAFPKLHGPPSDTGPRQYVLKLLAPTPTLTFEVLAEAATGGVEDRSAIVINERGEELKRLEFKINTPVTFELSDVKPGLYTAVFPEFGAEQLTVRGGGNVLGAVRAHADTWGFNPFRPADLKPGEGYKAYFAVPAGSSSMKVALATGAVALGFEGGEVIAPEVRGSPELQKQPLEFAFAASDKPRIAYVQWREGEYPASQGLLIEGVTLFSPDPSYVLFESLD